MAKLEPGWTVVWSGRDELLPPRPERHDDRLESMPSMDWDEDTVAEKPKRKYTRTGLHIGEFRRPKNGRVGEFRAEEISDAGSVEQVDSGGGRGSSSAGGPDDSAEGDFPGAGEFV